MVVIVIIFIVVIVIIIIIIIIIIGPIAASPSAHWSLALAEMCPLRH